MSMGTWKTKAVQKKGRASRTPGKSKNFTCQINTFKSFMAKRARSYKHRGYARWMNDSEKLQSF